VRKKSEQKAIMTTVKAPSNNPAATDSVAYAKVSQKRKKMAQVISSSEDDDDGSEDEDEDFIVQEVCETCTWLLPFHMIRIAEVYIFSTCCRLAVAKPSQPRGW
jgi:hypothetical protein